MIRWAPAPLGIWGADPRKNGMPDNAAIVSQGQGFMSDASLGCNFLVITGPAAARARSLGDKEHLPDVLAALQEAVCRGSVADRECGGNGHLDGAAPDQFQGGREIVGRRQPEPDDPPAVTEQRDQVE